MLRQFEKYQKPVLFGLAAFWVIGYAFLVGRASQHDEDRKQIEAAYKASKSVQGQQDANKRNAKPEIAKPDASEGKDGTPEISFLGVKLGEFLLIAVTGWLVLTTRELVVGAQKTAEKQLRAYVGVEPRGVKRFAGQDLLVGHIRIRNFGQIPAKNIAMFAVTDWYLGGSQRTFRIGDLYKTTTALQPRAKTTFGTATGTDLDAIPFDEEEGVLKGFVFVYGRVTYTDEFGTDGRTDFCHRYPCEMIEDADSRIRRKYARYHELGGNDAT